jgi:hypothetical protein
MLTVLLLAQVAGPPGDEPVLTATAECTRDAEEIVVCAGDPDAYRLKLEERQAAGLPAARFRVSPNKTLTLRGETAPLATAPVPRAMIDLTIAF